MQSETFSGQKSKVVNNNQSLNKKYQRLNSSLKKISQNRDQKNIQSAKKIPILSQLQQYNVYIDQGNNSQLVRRIILKRDWLIEIKNCNIYNFRWKPTSKDLPFAQLEELNKNNKTVLNHIENHRELTTKTRMYFNLKLFCKKQNIQMDEFVPLTFILDLNSISIQQDIKDFINIHSKFKLLNDSLWILKPPDLNRGQGITLFKEINALFSNISNFCNNSNSIYRSSITQILQSSKKSTLSPIQSGLKQFKVQYTQENGNNAIFQFQISNTNQNRVFIIQKYLENPFLYEGRKFDFRVWSLIDHNFNIYFFKEGYLRLSSELFDKSSKSLNNLFIHLTNNAIQKSHTQYNKLEIGNQLSFSDLQNFFNKKGLKIDVKQQIVRKMKDIILYTFQSVQEKLINKKYQFEIFGYDFMIDNSLKIWLIEINTNPCIEESSPLLEKLIPRMLNDAFRLTIDKVFNPLSKYEEKEIPYKYYNFLGDFAVPGYSNSENMWELIGSI